jgi:hypothetical protein
MIAVTTLRKLLFYLFVLIYILVCPVVILRVLGYDIRPGGKRQIVSTGDLYVASFPPGARLFIDGRQYSRPTPTSVLDLKPGSYRLRLWAEGYLPWTQTITVEPGKATVLDDVLLLPEHWPHSELDARAFEDILPSSEYPNLLLKRGPLLRDLFVYQVRRQAFLALPDSALGAARILDLVPLAGGSVLLIEVKLDSAQRRLLLTIHSGSLDIRDLTDLVPEGVGNLIWAAEKPEDLFFYRQGSVTRINVPAATVYPSFPYRVRGFGVGNDTLFFLTAAGDLLIQEYDSERARLPAGFRGIGALLPPAGFVRLTPLQDGTVILRAPGGELLTAGKAGCLALGKVEGFRIETDPLRLLLWQDQRVGVLAFGGAKEPKPKRPLEVQPEWIPVPGIKVQQAFFVLEGTYVLYRNGARVVLVCPERGGQRKQVPVVQVRGGTSVYYSDRNGKLFYLDSLTGRPSSLEIIGNTQLVDQLLLDIRRRIQP